MHRSGAIGDPGIDGHVISCGGAQEGLGPTLEFVQE